MKKRKTPLTKTKMLLWEKRAFLDGASLIIGVDEAGRGPLAGPVVAAAVLLNPSPLKDFIFPRYKERIDDSKKLRSSEREKAFKEISDKALFGVGIKNHNVIDRENIFRATLHAMAQAVGLLIKEYCKINSEYERNIKNRICVLIDGNIKPIIPYKAFHIKKGDSLSLSIAAASIIAKVTRDRMMVSYDKKYPMYGFSQHKGYGTRAHMEAIRKYGPCPIHRKTFAPIKYGF